MLWRSADGGARPGALAAPGEMEGTHIIFHPLLLDRQMQLRILRPDLYWLLRYRR